MKPPARVNSIDLLRDFRAALASFKAEGQDALTANALDIRRALDWLTERRAFWARAVRDCEEEVTHAKADLHRKQVLHPGDRPPDCTQEIKALKRAQARLEHAENQVEKCKRWEPTLQRAADEYEGPARALADLLEGDLPKSLNLLDRLVATLEEYLAVAPRPSNSLPSPGFAGEGGTFGRTHPMTLTTGRAKLVESLKVLAVRWEAARDGWDDQAGRDFEEKHVEPIAPQVQAAVRAIDRLAAVIYQMRHECE
jgi:hypothetical protein